MLINANKKIIHISPGCMDGYECCWRWMVKLRRYINIYVHIGKRLIIIVPLFDSTSVCVAHFGRVQFAPYFFIIWTLDRSHMNKNQWRREIFWKEKVRQRINAHAEECRLTEREREENKWMEMATSEWLGNGYNRKWHLIYIRIIIIA